MLIRIIVQRRTGALLGRMAAKRSFFASSTDHTRLLEEAEIHRLPSPDGDGQQYVMVAAGMEDDMVKKVPQLHLARLFVTANCLHGAKVVNRTLGPIEHVCGKLVDAALSDIQGTAKARSTLHGLSQWVLEGSSTLDDESDSSDHTATAVLAGLSPYDLDAIGAIATGSYNDDQVYEAGKDLWEQCAREYIKQKLAPEAALYESKGATLEAIEHHADTSEYANTSGGAMALFSF